MPVISPTGNGLRTTSDARGFTILELMVVIGIIVILIGILLPAIRGVQRAAKNATTTNLINTLGSAIDQYQSVQRDWPGPYMDNADRSSDQFTQVQGVALTKAPNDNNPTRTEELLLCISGGLNIGWNLSSGTGFQVSGNSYVYNPEDLDRGHVSLSPKNRGRLKPFMGAGAARSDAKAAGPQFRADTVIPEYLDAYGTPILYVRARKGFSGIVTNGSINNTAYYSYNTNDKVIADGPLRLEAERYVPDDLILFPPSYCEHATLPGQVVNQDRYVLISAGADKKFGTADDVANFTPNLK